MTIDNVYKFQPWEQPIPLTAALVPQWSNDLLPGVVGDFVAAVRAFTETPMELAMNDVLGVLSCAAGRKYEVMVSKGHNEVLAYWGLTIQPPATRKSSVKACTTAPLVEWELEQAAALKEFIQTAKSKRKTELEIIKGLRSKAGRVKTAQEREDIIQDVVDLEKNLTEVPTLPRLWTDDITPESLAVLMAENHERLGIFSAEGGVFGIMAGRYSNGNANLNIYLKGHAGDAERVDRGSRAPVYMDRPCLSMGLSVQPEVLRGLAKKNEFRGCGLLGRFVYAMPHSRLGSRTFNGQPVPGALTLGYAGRIKSILNREFAIDPSSDRVIPYVIQMSEDAYSVFSEQRHKIEKKMADGGELEHMRDWAGKLSGLTARVAALVHIARYATVKPEEHLISFEDMTSSILWANSALSHAMAVFDFMGADTDLEDARAVLRWINRHGLTEFTFRDVHHGNRRRFPKAVNLEPAMQVLTERHYIRPKAPPKGSNSRPFEVNPESRN